MSNKLLIFRWQYYFKPYLVVTAIFYLISYLTIYANQFRSYHFKVRVGLEGLEHEPTVMERQELLALY